MATRNGLPPEEGWSAANHRELIGGVLIILLLAALSILPLVTTPPPAQVGAAEFSIDRALEHIESIAQEAHPMGSAANVRVRTYVEQQLTALGLEVRRQSMTVPDYYEVPGATVEMVNVMARIAGSDSTKAVALVAHYDSVPTTAGANDNASGVAVLLETARALLAGPAIRNDVILLFTDGEEPAPRYGSRAFVAEHPWSEEVGFVVNFEAAGGSGPSMVVEMSGPQRWVVDGLAASDHRPVAFSFLTETIELIGGIGTDFDPFQEKNVPGVHLAYSRGTPIYHTFNDSVEQVGLDSVQQHGSNALSLSRHFGDLDLAQTWAPADLVFFSVGRSLIVSYPVDWAGPLAVLAAGLFLIAIVRRIKRGSRGIRSLLMGFGMVFTSAVVASMASTLLWRLLVDIRPMPVVAESYLYLFGLLAFGAVLSAAMWRIGRKRWVHIDQAESVVLVWVVLAVVTGFLTSGISYLFGWPALGGAVALLWPMFIRSQRWRLVPLALVAGPSLVVLVPAIDTFFQFAQPRPGNLDSEVVEAVAVVVFLSLLLLGLIASTAKQILGISQDGSALVGAGLGTDAKVL